MSSGMIGGDSDGDRRDVDNISNSLKMASAVSISTPFHSVSILSLFPYDILSDRRDLHTRFRLFLLSRELYKLGPFSSK